jgi:MSHA biogenesis protein MshQ
MRATDAVNATVSSTGFAEGTTEIRSGRSKISNAYGSELLPLQMTAAVQYWDGTSWVNSTTDNVTQFNSNLNSAGGNIVPVIVQGPLVLGNISVQTPGLLTVAAGIKTFTLSKPLVTGSADLSLNAPSYLFTGSNTAGVSPAIAGRATFGVYKSNNPVIYQREAY